MARTKNRLFSKFIRQINNDLTVKSEGIAEDAIGGTTIYATRSSLPSSGNTAGDQAYVTGNNRLYIWNGSGWYNVALLNLAPTISSVQDSDAGTTPFALSASGTDTTITITANDSDGDPLTYTATADSDFSGIATITNIGNVFTITPLSADSVSTSSGTITFTATDGINVASSGVQTFTLEFVRKWSRGETLKLTNSEYSTPYNRTMGLSRDGLQFAIANDNDIFVYERSINTDPWTLKYNFSFPVGYGAASAYGLSYGVRYAIPRSIAIGGDILVIADPNMEVQALQQAGVFSIWKWDGTDYNVAEVVFSNNAKGLIHNRYQYLGHRMEISADGTKLLVGTTVGYNSGTTSGSSTCAIGRYDIASDGTLTKLAQYTSTFSSGTGNGWGYDWQVSDDFSRVIIGAPFRRLWWIGYADVLTWNGSNYTRWGSLSYEGIWPGADPTYAYTNTNQRHYYGRSVDMSPDGTKIIVGSPGTGGDAFTGQKVFVYDFDGTTITKLAEINRPTEVASANDWGIQVGWGGDSILIYTAGDSTNLYGKIYKYSTEDYSHVGTIERDSPVTGERFGQSFKVRNETAIICAVNTITGTNARGETFAYDANY